MLKISFDAKKMARRAKLRQDALVKANVQALNRTVKGVRTDGARRVKGELNLKIGAIKERMALIKASRTSQVARLVTNGKLVPIIELGAKQNKKGVSVKVKGSGSRRTIRTAFIATMPKGHKGVYRRTGLLSKSGKRQIKEVFTTTVSQAMRGDAVSRANLLSVSNRYRKEFQAAKKNQMSKVR